MRKDKLVGEMLGEEMTLTPSDLYNTDFSTSLVGGYDKAEVDAFLERVGDVLERLLTQARELKAQTDTQKTQIDEFHEMEHTLRGALASSQKFSDDLLESARTKAGAILEEARVKAERIQADAERAPENLRDEIQVLKAQRERLRADIESILAAHMALLERIDSERAAGNSAAKPAEEAQEEPALDAIPEPWDSEEAENEDTES